VFDDRQRLAAPVLIESHDLMPNGEHQPSSGTRHCRAHLATDLEYVTWLAVCAKAQDLAAHYVDAEEYTLLLVPNRPLAKLVTLYAHDPEIVWSKRLRR
jgi:hypothetical protein